MEAMRKVALGISVLALLLKAGEAMPSQKVVGKTSPNTCVVIRGRAIEYRGDGFFAIWHIGTHHIFMPADAQSSNLICKYFDCESGDRQPALFANFTVCPTRPYARGAAQPAIVKRIAHPVVFADWPPPTSPRNYVQRFYSWYAGRVSRDDDNVSWMEMLKLARWDLSTDLATLLEKDAVAQSHCGEIVGIDFDPFLLTQDPSKKYVVGAITQKGDRYMAKVYRIEGGKREGTPDVTAEIAQRSDGRWYFVNFYGPDMRSGLLAILKSPMPKCTVPRP